MFGQTICHSFLKNQNIFRLEIQLVIILNVIIMFYINAVTWVLQQGIGHVTVLPAQAGCLGMLVQVRGLAKTFPTLETCVGFLSCVDANVFLAVSKGKEGFAADFTGVFPSSLNHQDIML